MGCPVSQKLLMRKKVIPKVRKTKTDKFGITNLFSLITETVIFTEKFVHGQGEAEMANETYLYRLTALFQL
jgi:hypothetical protein